MGKDIFNNGWFTVFLIAAHCTMDCIGRYSSGKYCIKPMIIGVYNIINNNIYNNNKIDYNNNKNMLYSIFYINFKSNYSISVVVCI